MKAVAKLLKRPQKIIGSKNVTMVTCPEFDDPVLFAVTQDIKNEKKTVHDWIKELSIKENLTKMREIQNAVNDRHYALKEVSLEELLVSLAIINWYKVLGELSPDAIWVKDGDAIETQQGKHLILLKWLYNKEFHPYKAEIYYVKCSNCNTYH